MPLDGYWHDAYATRVDHMGGVTISRRRDGTTRYLQPGDDAGKMLTIIERANVPESILQGYLSDYFA